VAEAVGTPRTYGEEPSAQGRYNAGQKLNGILTLAATLGFIVTGIILWIRRSSRRCCVLGVQRLHEQ